MLKKLFGLMQVKNYAFNVFDAYELKDWVGYVDSILMMTTKN